jgi:hypothetical protein
MPNTYSKLWRVNKRRAGFLQDDRVVSYRLLAFGKCKIRIKYKTQWQNARYVLNIKYSNIRIRPMKHPCKMNYNTNTRYQCINNDNSDSGG